MTDLATSPAAAPADDNTTRLVNAAVEVFAEKGYDKAGVAEIARRAGMTTGAIYSRFSGKAELLAAALNECVPNEFDALFAEHAFDGQVADVLRTVGSHLVTREPSSRTCVLLEAFVAARRDPELAAAIRDSLYERRIRLAGLIDTAKELGRIDPDLDTNAMVHLAQAVGFGFLGYEALGVGHPAPEAWEDLIAKVIGSVVRHPEPSRPAEPLDQPDQSATDPETVT